MERLKKVFGSGGARQQEMTPHHNAPTHSSRPLPTPRPPEVGTTSAGAYGHASAAGAPPYQGQGQHAAYRAQDDVSDFQQMSGRIVDAPGPRLGPKNEGEIRILIIGKTGNGKSTLGNILLDSNRFRLARGMASATRETDIGECGTPDGKQLKVIDTPDISNVGMRDGEKHHVVTYWRGLEPDVILLAVRCDVRYTPEEYVIFQELRKLWGDDKSFLSRLLVAFTFGDRLDNDIEEEMRMVHSKNKELSAVMNTGCRYFVFNGKAEPHERTRQRRDLLAYVYSRRTSSKASHGASTLQQPPEPMDFQEAPRKEMTTSSSSSAPPGHRTLRVLIVGKSGNGKSTVGNILLGEHAFTVSKGMAVATTHANNKSKEISRNTVLEVIDTPDIFNLPLDPKDRESKISVWKTLAKGAPDAILLTVRCDVRYTPEEFAIYKELRKLWGDSFLSRLVVAFTFSDSLDNPIEEELRKANLLNEELSRVLDDARGRYVLFSEKPHRGGLSPANQREAVLKMIDGLGR